MVSNLYFLLIYFCVGDGRLEWSEFTHYIIDSVLGQKDTKFFDAGQEKERDFLEQEILDRAYERKSKVIK
jgi:hypothetical protein